MESKKKAREVRFPRMKNTCDECGSRNGHEIWCSLNKEPMPEAPAEKVWFALTSEGRKLRFTLAPSADRDFALNYAFRNASSFGLFWPIDWEPETIISVEEA
jgi:hypothetical protein